MTPYKLIITITLFFMGLSPMTYSQPGTLDGDFDADGVLILNATAVLRSAAAVAQQTDGMLLVAGAGEISMNRIAFVARLNPDGSYDQNFGNAGLTTNGFGAQDIVVKAMTLQPDGKILIAGTSVVTEYLYFVSRFETDGSIDATFGVNGSTQVTVGTGLRILSDMKLQSDGKIVIGGVVQNSDVDIALVRLNADGSLDNSFSFDGKVETNVNGSDELSALAIDSDGKILIAGSTLSNERSLLVRYNSDGTLDNTFGTNGKMEYDLSPAQEGFDDLFIDGQGRLLLAGLADNNSSGNDFLAVRTLSDGSLDLSFSFDGMVQTDFFGSNDEAAALVLQPDGKLLLTGSSQDGNRSIALVRYLGDGTLDTDFGTNGKVTTDVSTSSFAEDVIIQADGKILVGATSYLTDYQGTLVRYISGINIGIGEVDTYIGSTLVFPNPITNDQVTIEYELKSNEMISIELFDLNGKIIALLQPSVRQQAGSYQQTFGLPGLSAGNYLMKLTTEKGAVSVKFMAN